MLGNDAILEEMFAQAKMCGTKFSKIFWLNNQKIDISKLVLSQEDWEILEMHLANRQCINLVFIIMVYHFNEKFSKENLEIFKTLGSRNVRKFATEFENLFKKIKSELKGVPVYA